MDVFQRWLFWPLFAAIIGFAIGGSFVWAIDHPNDQQHISQANPAADTNGDQNQPSKTFGKALSIIWDRTWDDPVAFYTFVLAIFTALLASVASVQIFFLIRADKTARTSAEAAQAAAKAFQITERPYIFIWGLIGTSPSISYAPSGGRASPRIVQDNAAFIYSISNRGKLAAVVETVSIACGYEWEGRYPPLIIIGDHRLVQLPVISSEQDVENISFEIPWQQLDRMRPTPDPVFRDGLIFRVVVAYRGPFTSEHETSQAWRYVRSLNGFAQITNKQYTYAR